MFLPVTADCFHYMTLVQLSVILPLNTYYVNLMVPPRRDSLINSPYFSLFLLSVFSFDFFASLSFVSQSFLLLVIVTFLPAPTALLAAKQHPKKMPGERKHTGRCVNVPHAHVKRSCC